MPYADDLIDQAKKLAAADTRKPKRANLARAVSASYYALFHAIVDKAVTAVLSTTNSDGLIGQRLRRVVTHDAINRAAKWFLAKPDGISPAINAMRVNANSKPPPVDPRLVRVCQLFTDLQVERHSADYDISAVFLRAEVVRRIADVEAAIEDLRALDATSGDTLIFLIGSILGERLTKNS